MRGVRPGSPIARPKLRPVPGTANGRRPLLFPTGPLPASVAGRGAAPVSSLLNGGPLPLDGTPPLGDQSRQTVSGEDLNDDPMDWAARRRRLRCRARRPHGDRRPGAGRFLQEPRPARHALLRREQRPGRRRAEGPEEVARSVRRWSSPTRRSRIRPSTQNVFKPFTDHLGAVHRQARRLLPGAVERGRDRGDALRPPARRAASRPARPASRSTSPARSRSRSRAPRRSPQGYHLIVDGQDGQPLPEARRPQGQEGRAHVAVVELRQPRAARAVPAARASTPDKDYKPLMSGGHDKSVLGVPSGDYDMAPVASDVFERMVDARHRSRTTTSASSTAARCSRPRRSPTRTTSSRSSRKKLDECFYDFRFPPEMQKEFDGDDRFFPITYKDDLGGGARRRREAPARPTTRPPTTRKPSARPKPLAKKQQQAAAGKRRRRSTEPAWTLRAADRDAAAAHDRALVIRNLRKEYAPASRCCDDVSLDDRRPRHHRDHRPVRHRQVDADPLHQPAGRADRRRDPVRRRRTSRSCAGAALRAARRRIGMVFQEYNLVERLTVMENLLCGPARLRLGLARLAAPLSRRRTSTRAFELLDAVGPRRASPPARRRALRRPAPARRHRARADAGAGAAARRRADLLARSEDLGRDHGADRRRRAGERDIPVIVNIHDVELAQRFADRIVGMSDGDDRVRRPAATRWQTTHLRRRSTAAKGWLE